MSDVYDYAMNIFEKGVYKKLVREIEEYQKMLSDYSLFINKDICYAGECKSLYGYKWRLGYFSIFSERGETYLDFHTRNKDQMIAEWLNCELFDYTNKYLKENEKELKKEWHYYTDYEEVEGNFISIQRVSESYRFDREYEQRKYRFDFILRAVQKAGIPERIVDLLIKKYQDYMNDNHLTPAWIYDKETMEFVLEE